MENPRFHGNPPYTAVTVHGGPGAQGSAWPFAHGLGGAVGVLEPMQTRDTVDGQAEELRSAIERHAAPPAVLIGHSWGAWLAFITAARYPDMVRKLILVGSGPFEERWTQGMMETRLGRLRTEEAEEVRRFMAAPPDDGRRDAALARVGALLGQADTYCPMPGGDPYESVCDAGIHERVWAEAAEMRRSGALLGLAERIACPVVAIHGDYDPHPWRGVKEPLEARVRDFRFVLLERCGHEPWDERYARDRFFQILRREVAHDADNL